MNLHAADYSRDNNTDSSTHPFVGHQFIATTATPIPITATETTNTAVGLCVRQGLPTRLTTAPPTGPSANTLGAPIKIVSASVGLTEATVLQQHTRLLPAHNMYGGEAEARKDEDGNNPCFSNHHHHHHRQHPYSSPLNRYSHNYPQDSHHNYEQYTQQQLQHRQHYSNPPGVETYNRVHSQEPAMASRRELQSTAMPSVSPIPSNAQPHRHPQQQQLPLSAVTYYLPPQRMPDGSPQKPPPSMSHCTTYGHQGQGIYGQSTAAISSTSDSSHNSTLGSPVQHIPFGGIYPQPSPLSPQRKSTTEWKVGDCFPPTASNVGVSSDGDYQQQTAGDGSYWPSCPHSDYRRKELPAIARINSSSSMLSPPQHYAEKYERSRSMSTVEPVALTEMPPSSSFGYSSQHHSTPLHDGYTSTPANHSQHQLMTTIYYPSLSNQTESVEPVVIGARRTQSTATNFLTGPHDANRQQQAHFIRDAVHHSSCGSAKEAENGGKSSKTSTLQGCYSLRRFNSMLRKVSNAGSMMALGMPGFTPLLSFTPYTPPPILSPTRKGTGLFCHVSPSSDLPSRGDKAGRKYSAHPNLYSTPSKRSDALGAYGGNGMILIPSSNKVKMESTTASANDENNPACKRRRVDLEGREAAIATSFNAEEPVRRSRVSMRSTAPAPVEDDNESDGERGVDVDSARRNDSVSSRTSLDPLSGSMEVAPHRKNGLFLNAAGGDGTEGSFVAELEALRKESAASDRSTPLHGIQQPRSKPRPSITEGSNKHQRGHFNDQNHPQHIYHPRMSMMRTNGLLAAGGEDFVKKMSSVSVVESNAAMPLRKESSMSEVGGVSADECHPPESDCIPHINLGKGFQARVKKWADREITALEREAIPDRDEMVFDPTVIDHLPQTTVAAYEALACSVACPRLGHNKELALHILTENKGNIQSAVMDLLRSDTLDWEQYPSVYYNLYVDVDNWSPADVDLFQEYLFESEKDFHHVANKLGNRTVQQCVAFYYTWKKACPDDYRKLRNLRRKRQLLEQQLDFAAKDENPASVAGAATAEGGDNEDEEADYSEAESVASLHSFSHALQRQQRADETASAGSKSDTSPSQRSNGGRTVVVTAPSPIGVAPSNAAYPWIHGGGDSGVFSSPSSSSSFTFPSSEILPRGNALDSSAAAGAAHTRQQYSTPHKVTQRGVLPGTKKGAQPQADGFFHCRLCDKRFEKVKSLNAHMKSHAMKARAEAESHNKLLGGGAGSPMNVPLLHGKLMSKMKSPRDVFDPDANSSPLNLSQSALGSHHHPSSAPDGSNPSQTAAAVAAALGQLSDLNSRLAAAKMGNLLSPQDFVSAAMNHLAVVSGASNGNNGNLAAFAQANSIQQSAANFPYASGPLGTQQGHSISAAQQQQQSIAQVALQQGGLNEILAIQQQLHLPSSFQPTD